ncbi:MAG: dihydrofolate reductase [Bacteroidetes bacterium]|nr:dihydrofolate reductase [Bacteroidota bacterium]
MIISAIVAAGLNNEIGGNGDLLWVLPKDMAHFKNKTWGHHVLMGRKSYEALPPKYRPLPGRPNIVVSRDPDLRYDGCKNVTSIEAGVKFAEINGEEELMITGGGEIYRLALPFTDRIYLTRVHATFPQADTYFPELDMKEWEEVSKESYPSDEKHAFAFDIIELQRKK